MNATLRCERRGCGSVLVRAVDVRAGETRLECPGCNRRKIGLCIDCPAPLPSPSHRRCAACALTRERAIERDRARRKRKTHPELIERDRERKRAMRLDPVLREKLNAQQRASKARRNAQPKTPPSTAEIAAKRAYDRWWRQTHPPTAADKANRRDWYREKYANDPEFRERIKAGQRRRRTARRALENARARERYHARQRAGAGQQSEVAA